MDDKEGPEGLEQEPRTRCREASEASCAWGKRKRRGGFGKLLLVGIIGAGVALAVSETARKTVMDSLFGAEEEFEYTSTTSGNSGG